MVVVSSRCLTSLPVNRDVAQYLQQINELIMSAIVATSAGTEKEAPMHIDVQDLTFGYAGREVLNSFTT